MNGIYIKFGRRTFRVVKGDCTKRTCDLFKAGVCDFDGDGDYVDVLPCIALHDMASVGGVCLPFDANFKEVKEVAK